jgi:hypothetical protein
LPALSTDLSNLMSALEELEAEVLSPLYPRISRQLKIAYLRDGLSGINAVYRDAIEDLSDAQVVLIEEAIALAANRAGASYASEIETVPEDEGESAFNLFVLGLLISPSKEMLEVIIPRSIAKDTIANPDYWGLKPADRVRRNASLTITELHIAALQLFKSKRRALDALNKIRSVDINDARLPQHLLEVERAARRVLANSPGVKQAFVRAVNTAREVAKRRVLEGPLQKEFLDKLEMTVIRGHDSGIDKIIQQFIEGRHRLRGITLLQSIANDAYQKTNLKMFQADRAVLAVKWNLSSAHIHFDRCDILANADIGLGAGVYFKHNVPWRPHANCACYMTSVRSGNEDVYMPVIESDYQRAIDVIEGPVAKEADRIGRSRTMTEGQKRTATQGLFNSIPKVEKQ